MFMIFRMRYYKIRFRTIIRPYYRGAAGIVLAYDVTDEKTFKNIEDWTLNIAENTQTCQIIPKVLIANKTDLPPESHRIQVICYFIWLFLEYYVLKLLFKIVLMQQL